MESSCEWGGKEKEYRYVLRRFWDKEKPKIVFIGLNPSTADEQNDDNTVRRCLYFARRDGFGGMIMLNAFAYRSTSPILLSAAPNPIGLLNDYFIEKECNKASKIVVAWGNNVSDYRHLALLRTLSGYQLWCFDKNKSGKPKHPLYVSKNKPLVPYI